MLVLSRKTDQEIILRRGAEIIARVQVVRIKGGTVRLGIDAPQDVSIARKEVEEAKE